MTTNILVQIGLYFLVLLALAKPLGWYMARVYEAKPCGLDVVLGPIERALYRLSGIRPADEMDWKVYGLAMLLFNAAGLLLLYGLQRVQHLLPLNPAGLGIVAPDLAFNTAVSFATNTNWQAYGERRPSATSRRCWVSPCRTSSPLQRAWRCLWP